MTDLVMHATKAIAEAHRGRSPLPTDVLALPGHSSRMVRRLLNHLCHFRDCHFLEVVGALHGATAIAAGYANVGRFVTVDDFSRFGGTREACAANLAAFAPVSRVELVVGDAWEVPLEDLAPVDVFFYDGDHAEESHRRAIEHFAPIMAETCVVVVDDWNWAQVRAGTRAALPARAWYPLARWELFTRGNRDVSSWWNGLFVGVYSTRVA